MDIDDYDMGSNEGPGLPPQRRLPIGAALAAVVVLAGLGFVGYKVSTRTAPPVPTPAPRVEATPVPSSPQPSEEPAADLPALDESDAFARDLLRGVSGDARWAEWLKTTGLVRRFVVVVENVAEGQNPASHLSFLALKDTFRPETKRGSVALGAAGYARFDPVGATAASLDADKAAAAYRRLHPLLTAAYKQLGSPDGFDAALERAIVVILRTPVLEGDVPLVYQPPYYRYADPTLEALQPIQKQLLRMGPRNERRVQDKVREIGRAIGIPDERMR